MPILTQNPYGLIWIIPTKQYSLLLSQIYTNKVPSTLFNFKSNDHNLFGESVRFMLYQMKGFNFTNSHLFLSTLKPNQILQNKYQPQNKELFLIPPLHSIKKCQSKFKKMKNQVQISLCLLYILCISSINVIASSTKKDLFDAPLLTSKIDTNRTIIVGPKEKITSVQDGIDQVPDGNSEWIIVHLRAGIYREKVTIPKNKEYIFLRGNGRGRTAIVWNDGANDNSMSATFTVNTDNFVAFGISFKNDAPLSVKDAPFNRSVAAKVSGDRAAFYHCAFYSPHNTLFDNRGRHYYESCYIQGNIDFIFGRGQTIFQGCEIFVLADRRREILGSITAQNRRSKDENSGFVFIEGKVYGTGDVYLGRANGGHSRVIWAKTYLSRSITPHGWTNWSYDGSAENLELAEYHTKGPGAESAARALWSRQLTEEEAAPYLTVDFIDGREWLKAYH